MSIKDDSEGTSMAVCMDNNLIGKVTIITLKTGIVVGEIVKLNKEYFAMKVISDRSNGRIDLDDFYQIQIENEQSTDVYVLLAKIESVHNMDATMMMLIRPIEEKRHSNKRQSARIKLSAIYDYSISMSFKKFPPIGQKWIRGRASDISTGGVQLVASDYISSGQLIEVQLNKPFVNESEIIVSRIVHVRKEGADYVYSIQFLNLSEKHSERLYEFVQLMKSTI